MSKPSKREAERNQQELKTLLEVPENTQCADCGDPKPKWASANLGVFLCIRCAGLHRNMGRDVSAIKSVTLDSWSDKEVMRMKEIGNRRARALYLARGNPPPVSVNSPDQDVYRLIKDKYKHGKYMRSGDKKELEAQLGHSSAPLSNNRTRSESSRQHENVTIEPDDHVSFAGQLKMLSSMGFIDTTKCLLALKRGKGSIDAAVEILISSATEPVQPLPSTTAVAAPSWNDDGHELSKTLKNALEFLQGMGFTDEVDNLAALKQAGGNVDKAVTILVNAPPKPKSLPTNPKSSHHISQTPGDNFGVDLLSLEDAPVAQHSRAQVASDSPFSGFFGQPPAQPQLQANQVMPAYTHQIQEAQHQAQFQQQQQQQLMQQQLMQQQLMQQKIMQQQLAQHHQQFHQEQQLVHQQPFLQQQQVMQPQQQAQQAQMWATLASLQPQTMSPSSQSMIPQQQPQNSHQYDTFPSSSNLLKPNYNPQITPSNGSIFTRKESDKMQTFSGPGGPARAKGPDPFASLLAGANMLPAQAAALPLVAVQQEQAAMGVLSLNAMQRMGPTQGAYATYSVTQPQVVLGGNMSHVPRSMQQNGMPVTTQQQQQQSQLQTQQFQQPQLQAQQFQQQIYQQNQQF